MTIDDAIEGAVREVVERSADALPGVHYYAISAFWREDSWFFVSIVGLGKLGPELQWRLDDASWFGLVLLHQDKAGNFTGAVEGTQAFSVLLAEIPETILTATARQSLDPLQRSQAPASTYRFPWPSGTNMQYGVLGVHDAGFNGWGGISNWKAVDFLSDNNTGAGHAPNRLLAAASGTIGAVCNDGTSVAIRIGDLLYAHLLNNSNLQTGHSFSQGNEIGQLKTGSFNANCGWADQGGNWFHVHWGFPNTGSLQVEDWTLNFSDQQWHRGNETRRTLEWIQASGGGSPPPTCPTSGGVILYKDWQYNCGGEGEGSGWVRRDSTGWQNVGGFNDRASSVRVPSGWSVKLFEHSDRGGGWACRNSNDDNFGGNQFNNGASLNDAVSSFEVFNVPNCGDNHAPNTPSLQSPGDGHVATDGRAPQLCWNNNGDPDGDSVQFYAEVYGSAVNANSGWTGRTCWWPSNLDGQYHNYQWHVKARDNYGAESGWSTTWHFTIQQPNQPPSISFNTANGSTAGQISSRDRTWAFAGTATDPEGQLNRIEFRCDNCDNAGSGPNQTNGNTWSLTRTDMAGQNDVYFVAYDNLNQ
ncbi:MAG: hypothetical protein WA029_16920, partial [Anaerolineae bacterium]